MNTKKVNKKKIASIALATTMISTLMIGSFAYFTDRADTRASATAGTVDIELNADALANAMKDNDGKDIFNPGDMREINYELSNKGNKSIDVRETIILTSSVAMDKEAAQAEYEIYKAEDVELIEGKGYSPVDGSNPLSVRSISDDGTQITYTVDEYILNGYDKDGDDTKREIENGVTATNNSGAYVLLFKGTAGNEFQNSTVTLDILAEAKQHRNTANVDWTELASESISFGGADTNVVPEYITPAVEENTNENN